MRDRTSSSDYAINLIDDNASYDGGDLFETHGFLPGAASRARTEHQWK